MYISRLNVEVSSSIEMRKDVGAPTAIVVFKKRNYSPNVTDVDVKKPVELCKSSRKANEVRNGPFPSESSTEVRLPLRTIKLTQTKTE